MFALLSAFLQLRAFVEEGAQWQDLEAACTAKCREVDCVEIGCGSGACTRWLAAKGYNALGIDLIEGAVALVRPRSISVQPANS